MLSLSLLKACSRDLLAAAVGGSQILSKTKVTDKESTDLTVLTNPSFSVSKSLVQTLTLAVGNIHNRLVPCMFVPTCTCIVVYSILVYT